MFWIGFMLGFSFGVATMALMIAARRGDELNNDILNTNDEQRKNELA